MSTLQMNRRTRRNVAAQKVQKTSVEVGIKDKQGRIVRQKWEGLREENYQEKIWWRWQWWQIEPTGTEELPKPVLKMEKNRKWGDLESMRTAQADCIGCRKTFKRKNSPRYGRMKSTAPELENAQWNTQRHLFSLPKPWMFQQSIQEFTGT